MSNRLYPILPFQRGCFTGIVAIVWDDLSPREMKDMDYTIISKLA